MPLHVGEILTKPSVLHYRSHKHPGHFRTCIGWLASYVLLLQFQEIQFPHGNGDVGSFSQAIVFRRHFFLIVNDDPFPNLKITPTPFILHNCFHHWGCPFGTSPKCWSLLIRQHLCNFFCGVSAQCSEEDIFYGLSLFFLDDETASIVCRKPSRSDSGNCPVQIL